MWEDRGMDGSFYLVLGGYTGGVYNSITNYPEGAYENATVVIWGLINAPLFNIAQLFSCYNTKPI